MSNKMYLARKMLLTLLIMIGAVLLNGCQNGDTPDKSTESIKYATMWNYQEPQALFLRQMAIDFEKETGINVNIEAGGRNILTKIRSRFMMGEPPDLIDQDFNELAAAISTKALEVIDLTEVLHSTSTVEEDVRLIDVFGENLVKLYEIEGKSYFFPYEFITSGFFYNKSQFENYGISAPKTWSEFMSNNAILNNNGIRPLGADGTINFYNAYYFCWAVQRILGTGALKEAAEDQDGSTWDDPGFLQAAEIVYELSKAQKNHFQDRYNESEWPNAQIEWAKGNYGSLLCSTWIPSETKVYAQPGFKYGFYPFPEIYGGKGKNTDVEVSFIGCVIPRGAKNIDNAKAFLKFISRKENAQKFSDITNTISARKDVTYPEDLADLRDYKENMINPYKSYDGVWLDIPGWWTNVFLGSNDKLIFGEIEPKKFIEKIKTDSKAFWIANNKDQ